MVSPGALEQTRGKAPAQHLLPKSPEQLLTPKDLVSLSAKWKSHCSSPRGAVKGGCLSINDMLQALTNVRTCSDTIQFSTVAQNDRNSVQNAQMHQKVSHGQDTLCIFILMNNVFRDVIPVSNQGFVHSLTHFIVIPVLHSWKPQTVIGVTLGVAV